MSDRKGAKGREPDEVRKGGPSWGEIVGERNYERGNLRKRQERVNLIVFPPCTLASRRREARRSGDMACPGKGKGGKKMFSEMVTTLL